VGKSHVHNEWVAGSLLMGFARRKLLNFRKKHGAAPCNFQVRHPACCTSRLTLRHASS